MKIEPDPLQDVSFQPWCTRHEVSPEGPCHFYAEYYPDGRRLVQDFTTLACPAEDGTSCIEDWITRVYID
jgi:hypothetical protein